MALMIHIEKTVSNKLNGLFNTLVSIKNSMKKKYMVEIVNSSVIVS